jgi:transglutaminase-like putative cysteine protease
VTGQRAWLGALVIAVAVLTGVHTLGALLLPGGWSTAATLVVVVVLLAAALTRTLAPPEWAPVSALLAGTLTIVVGYGGETGAALPGSRTLEHLGALLDEGAATIREGAIPVPPTRGLELFVVIGAAAAAVAVDALALSVRTVGAAGLALAALWTPTLMFQVPPSAGGVVVAAVAWVLLAWLSRTPRPPDRGPWRELPGAALVAALVAAGALLLGPVATALPGFGSVRLPAMWGSGIGGGAIGLSSDLDMRRDLGDRPARPVLRYTTSVTDLGPLRTATLMEFDGKRWGAGDGLQPRTAVGLLWPQDAASPAPDVQPGQLDVHVLDLEQRNLPIPVEPRQLADGQPWGYDEQRDEVTGDVAPGIDYSLAVLPRDVSADALRGDSARDLPPDAPELTVPQTPFSDRITALAREVTQDGRTSYDKALALQTWFRGGGGFVYDTTLAPARTADPLWDFLQSKRGYCVQYSTAMAVMARELGIPARVAVGFLPGTRAADGTVTVTADRAHAWPELWFARTGWVRFEPTPATQSGLPPRYADPFANTVAPTPTPTEAPLPTALPTQSPRPTTPGSTAGGAQQGGPLALWALVGGSLLTLAGVAVLLVRRRSRVTAWGPEEAWTALRLAAEQADVRWPVGSTPRQAGRALRHALSGDHDAQQATARLVALVEEYRYAPAPAPVDPDDLRSLVDRATAALSAGRRDGAPSAARVG